MRIGNGQYLRVSARKKEGISSSNSSGTADSPSLTPRKIFLMPEYLKEKKGIQRFHKNWKGRFNNQRIAHPASTLHRASICSNNFLQYGGLNSFLSCVVACTQRGQGRRAPTSPGLGSRGSPSAGAGRTNSPRTLAAGGTPKLLRTPTQLFSGSAQLARFLPSREQSPPPMKAC